MAVRLRRVERVPGRHPVFPGSLPVASDALARICRLAGRTLRARVDGIQVGRPGRDRPYADETRVEGFPLNAVIGQNDCGVSNGPVNRRRQRPAVVPIKGSCANNLQ
jgi:hypothetical protein